MAAISSLVACEVLLGFLDLIPASNATTNQVQPWLSDVQDRGGTLGERNRGVSRTGLQRLS